jgi:hypothetical protein
MPTCIYCQKEHVPTGELVHVFPEAIVANTLHLPHGTVCGKCNNYCGHELDSIVAEHPFISIIIQFLQLPGKRGLRSTIGPVKRLDDGSIAIELSPAHVSKTADGGRVTVGPDHNFDFARFRRAIHHISFNLFACDAGADQARKQHFDPVRRYIRQPRPGEAWTIVQSALPLDHIRPVVTGRRVQEAPGETILLRIFNTDFYVDLLNRGGLPLWANKTLGEGATEIAPDWIPGRTPRLGKHRFRLRIEPPKPTEAT